MTRRTILPFAMLFIGLAIAFMIGRVTADTSCPMWIDDLQIIDPPAAPGTPT